VIDIGRITLMLSNQCPNARSHRKCPAHVAETIEVLPARIVRDVIDTLAANGHQPAIAWHCYNEPLIDPRLFAFIEFARLRLPESPIVLWSSAIYLDDGLAAELEAAGVTHWYLTSYSAAEHARLTAMATRHKTAWRIFTGYLDDGQLRLDDRMTIGPPIPPEERQPCNAPIGDLTIWPTGEVGLCCFDWQRTAIFGDLRTTSFADFLASQEECLRSTQAKLRAKEPPFDICRQCRHRR